MNLKKIIPRAGVIVPLPDGNGNLPADGKVLGLTSYWYQRRTDGDVTFEDAPVDAPAVAPAAAPAEAAPEAEAPPVPAPKAKGK